MIVETEHDHVVAAKELRLVEIRGVLLQRVGRIEMRIERRLVRDQEVLPAAAAFSTTSSVAIIVVAMPFTAVLASPAMILSTVSVRQATPTFVLMRSMIWAAVNVA